MGKNMMRLRYHWVFLFVFVGLSTWAVNVGGVELPGVAGKEVNVSTPEEAFSQGEFAKTLELLEPRLAQDPSLATLQRLKWLSLVRLGKTSEGLAVFEAYSRQLGHQEALLLRELAIQSILPFRTDMREQIRGAAYTALNEVESDDVVPYLEEGVTDGTGMVRALIAQGLGNLHAGRESKRFHALLNDQAGFVRATVLKGLGMSGNKEVVPVLKKSLNDAQPLVQVAAAGALVHFRVS